MQNIPYMLATVMVGILISAQPPLNAVLARHIGSSVGATTISIFVALICMLAISLLFGAGELTSKSLSSVPWWAYLAGVIGAIFVASGVVITPVTGALVYFVCLIAGQLIGATLADQFGAMGLSVREISFSRLSGVALVIVGVFLVSLE